MDSKYNIGDVVYKAWFCNGEAKEVQCPDCLGKKVWKVILPSGESFTVDCDTCRRSCYDPSTGVIKRYINNPKVEKMTIGSVRINTADEKPISYMCIETGVGSGTIHYEETLFNDEFKALEYATILAKKYEKEKNEKEEKIKKKRKKNIVKPINKKEI